MGLTSKLSYTEVTAMSIASIALMIATWAGWLPFAASEVFGFVTGGICVWLVVRENIWNWPIGILNNIAFAFLFWHGRLYADMGLQGVYLALAAYGWWNWLSGSSNDSELRIGRTRPREWIALACFIPVATWILREMLIVANGAAPFWDSLSTVFSLSAQYLLCWKRLENWWFWIAADLIYVPLYFSRGLPLTGLLYSLFLAMCLIGLLEWGRRRPRENLLSALEVAK